MGVAENFNEVPITAFREMLYNSRLNPLFREKALLAIVTSVIIVIISQINPYDVWQESLKQQELHFKVNRGDK